VGVREGGNERFCENVIRRLGRVAPPGDEYYVFSYRGAAAQRLSDPTLIHVPLRRRSVAWQRAVEIPRFARRLRLDVLHVPFNFLPAGRARKIVTIYDLAFLHFPKTLGPIERARLTLLTGVSARRADHVVTVSEASKRDITERYGVPPARITVAPAAVEPDVFRPPSDGERQAFRARSGFTFEYLLHVGTLHPRKNLPALVEAYARLRACGRTDHHLVLVGRRERGASDIFASISARGLEAVVHHVETLDESDLAGAYGAATALVLPSFYEGFGVPALEAMSCGCPVLSSFAGALPEVCGDAAVLFDPRDPEALSAQLQRVVDDAELRRDLARRGLANAARYSWERTAALLADLYHGT
jgi:glycosyltransferase involved in cell wall biosynthesis